MTDDSDDLLEPTPLEHQDVYDVARNHGYASVAPSDSREILALQFGPLDDRASRAAANGYAAGVKERAEHEHELTRPVVVNDDRIPF